MLKQGTLTEGKGHSTVDLLIKVPCFVTDEIMFSISKEADLN
jgi:hypothetical protein